jgi:phenylacetate-coenzyme A ligase PaaK-like adenylate-forming protein
MLETAVAQLRIAASLLLGIPFAQWSLDWLVQAACATRQEFGQLGHDGALVLDDPEIDADTRREMQFRHFRAQAKRAARETRYYEQLFVQCGLESDQLRFEDIANLPVTTKEALRDAPDDFVRRTAAPSFRAMTTGTTGQPTSVSFSNREMHAMIALATIGALSRGDLVPEDVVHIGSSARATLGNLNFAGACARVGAHFYVAGVIEPAATLSLLAEVRHLPGKKRKASVLNTYPSYLGELVSHGVAAGYRPQDFGLERIFVGGELVTAGLRTRCETLFGPVRFVETYGMTETFPFGGTACSQGHLHFSTAHGLLEIQIPDTAAPAEPGDAGNLIATPFAPFRETTILLRYDTGDVVRRLVEPPCCELRHRPAVSNLLGKRCFSVRHDHGWLYPRDVLESLEALEAVPLPARCGFWAVQRGVAVEVLVRNESANTRRLVWQSLEQRGVPVRELLLVEDSRALRQPLPRRSDLRDATFDSLVARVAERGLVPGGPSACSRS